MVMNCSGHVLQIEMELPNEGPKLSLENLEKTAEGKEIQECVSWDLNNPEFFLDRIEENSGQMLSTCSQEQNRLFFLFQRTSHERAD
ncbi:hypothetical protein AVEN_181812-1 [Araneus ventricosus]|uniref:Uncharacterized protein n=1 Tax=Araneus ventricosus TaxID=182803 RepID=A0A4Y2Q5D5_ARAVE|nr:hypothetical protein AVEN_181812-1 [Araneus ventricosus]